MPFNHLILFFVYGGGKWRRDLYLLRNENMEITCIFIEQINKTTMVKCNKDMNRYIIC